MMSIFLNGEKRKVEPMTSLACLIDSLNFASPHFAVAVNRTIISKKNHSECLLNEGDEVEIVHPVGGG